MKINIEILPYLLAGLSVAIACAAFVALVIIINNDNKILGQPPTNHDNRR